MKMKLLRESLNDIHWFPKLDVPDSREHLHSITKKAKDKPLKKSMKQQFWQHFYHPVFENGDHIGFIIKPWNNSHQGAD